MGTYPKSPGREVNAAAAPDYIVDAVKNLVARIGSDVTRKPDGYLDWSRLTDTGVVFNTPSGDKVAFLSLKYNDDGSFMVETTRGNYTGDL